MNRLKKFVLDNEDIIDDMNWEELYLKIEDSDLYTDQITKLTDMLQETTGLPGLKTMWTCFCIEKKLGTYIIPETVQNMSYNLFVDTEIDYLKLSPKTSYIDDEAFYRSRIRQLELWETNPIKVLGSRLPKQYLSYVRYHGSIFNILERINLDDYGALFKCDDGEIKCELGMYPVVTWSGTSATVKSTFESTIPVRCDSGLVVECSDGRSAIWDEDGGFEIE